MKLSTKLALLTLLALAWASVASAQSIALAPAQILENFTPGVPFEYALAVQNKGAEAVELHVDVTDFWYNAKNEKVFGAPGTSPRSAANWIQFVPEKFEVPPGGAQSMKAIITPPADARGGYYAVLFVESKPIDSQQVNEGKRVYTNMRLGCLVMLTAKGTEAFNINLGDLHLNPPSDNQGLKLTFSIDNQSNTHVFPQAHMAILNPDHKLMGKAETQSKRFLPGQKDTMEVNWNGDLAAGDYTAVLSLVFGGTHVETRQVAFTVPAKTASK
jgi:methionine-rich copper-binding protein CopC